MPLPCSLFDWILVKLMNISSRVAFTYLPNISSTVKYFQTSCTKYSAAAATVATSANQTFRLPIHQSAFDNVSAIDSQMPVVLAAHPLGVWSALKNPSVIDVTENDNVDDSSTFLPKDAPSYDVGTVELIANELDGRMLKSIKELFPDKQWSEGQLTAVTICLRTELNMGEWSPEIEAERNGHLESFIQSAAAICQSLRSAGHWADFIDPSSGRPYLSETETNAILIETDARVPRLSGGRLTVDDLGCCRVVVHKLWDMHAYVGFLFTEAPREHPVLERMRM